MNKKGSILLTTIVFSTGKAIARSDSHTPRGSLWELLLPIPGAYAHLRHKIPPAPSTWPLPPASRVTNSEFRDWVRRLLGGPPPYLGPACRAPKREPRIRRVILEALPPLYHPGLVLRFVSRPSGNSFLDPRGRPPSCEWAGPCGSCNLVAGC